MLIKGDANTYMSVYGFESTQILTLSLVYSDYDHSIDNSSCRNVILDQDVLLKQLYHALQYIDVFCLIAYSLMQLIRMITDGHLKGVEVPHVTYTHAMELKPYIEEPLSKYATSLSFIDLDLRPRMRHDFILSSKATVNEYWQTLEYCYAAADPRSALLAFPGSAVHEVCTWGNVF